MWERYGFGGTLLVEDISTVTAMVLSVGEGEGGPTSHANVRVAPFWWGTAIKHAGGDVLLWWEPESFTLQ